MKKEKGIGLIQTFKSVLSSFIGIQNSKTHNRDFTKGKAKDFILIGLITTVLFVLMIIFLVNLAVNLITDN
tara:strand:- start:309 stop:521 length:213 start_codon:yes stop_codon:yes gene_type:complete